MVNNLMRVLASKAAIAQHLISVKRCARLYVPLNQRLDSLFLAIRKSHCAYFTAALQQSEGHSLSLATCTGNAPLASPNVHVASFATDERLIRFNFARSLTAKLFMHREANTVHHEPRRLLGDAK
jgi:hypothetical protein